MNARAQTRHSGADQSDILKHLQFQPVFGEDGSIVDIRELKISSDRRAGIKAMRDLYATYESGDEVLGADGWTGKQRRIISSPAPLDAHYLRYSQKWDARTGMMRDAALIQLPLEVVWTMFELLFWGQYDVTVKEEIFKVSEEIVPQGTDHRGEKADDAPGRRFYNRTTVAIRIHLPGQTSPRVFEGVGVSYGQLGTEKTGNVFAINSEERTVDKGAVADAKREALSSIGPIFRRAFEDGSEMIDHVEHLLLGKIQEMNRPAIHQRASRGQAVPAPTRKASPAPIAKPSATQEASTTAKQASAAPDKALAKKVDPPARKETVPAPARRQAKPQEKPQADSTPDQVSVKIPGAPERKVDRAHFTASFIDMMFETCVTGKDAQEIIRANSKLIEDLVEDRSEIDAVATSMAEQPEDEIPDFGLPEAEDEGKGSQPVETPAAKTAVPPTNTDLRIDVDGKSGKAVLGEITELCKAAKTVDGLNAIIQANPAALRKMTPSQMTKFSDLQLELTKKLNS